MGSRPTGFGLSRGPARPAASAPAAEGVQPLFERAAPQPVPQEPEPEPEPAYVHQPEPVSHEPAAHFDDDEPFELDDEAHIEADEEPVHAGHGTHDDWDDEAADTGGNGGYASLTGMAAPARDAGELDLGGFADEHGAHEAADDGLLGEASRLVDEDTPAAGGLPGRRRGLVSGDGGHGGGGDGGSAGGRSGAVAGATLFERMANLSRGARADKDDDQDDDEGEGSSISIPRFLGRQNNQ